ncbi:zinc-dependent alcohol dehydrogenase [Amycolatopsis granulosa]|uniref:zinc-dependent alcohol dehydrogenase n=1 Tax=Amycolatopsis granulosa TaxID=185684 RepID=UPI00141D8E93|nr:alcohol dehydrogenase catalytic domain-containing protein [Amycolatopsis granulosa]NIH85251.1 (R,R)-butanediol dehydrogenase/meso-butanediol dehydrogenase/diacetyl reductase [Amycolatopsis granulosa]
MRAAVFHDRDDIRIENVPEPTCGPRDLVLEVRAVGICGTDAHEYHSGPHMFPVHDQHPVSGHIGPMIPGHEFSGVVREVGPEVTGFAVGDLVVSGAGIACGECVQCRRVRTNLCERYTTVGLQRHGALAEYVATPAANCLQVAPYGLTPDAAALAQPMSIAVHAMRRGRLTGADHAVIVGAGGIGAFLTFAAKSVTDHLLVIDIDEQRLKIADALGAPHVLRTGDPDEARAAVGDLGLDPTVVYEVSGTPAGLRTALSILPRGGRLVLVGLQGRPVEWDVRTLSLIEHELIGTNAHVFATDMPTALELLASRPDPWTDLAPIALSLDQLVPEGLQPLVERRSTRIKTLIDPHATTTRETRMVAGA